MRAAHLVNSVQGNRHKFKTNKDLHEFPHRKTAGSLLP